MNMGSGIMVHRSEVKDLEKIRGWILLFGRRKVGKTYMIRNFMKYDGYYYVRIDGSVRFEGRSGVRVYDVLNDFVRSVRRMLNMHKTVVIDEFQRLPLTVLEDIASVHPRGRLILSGSSLRVVNKVLSRKSPLLGLVYPYKLGVLKATDVLIALCEFLDAERAVEVAPYLRDPWTIPMFSDNFMKALFRAVPYIVPGLVGEIFTAEEREMTRTYSSILSMIGCGVSDYHEIASTLYGRGLIKRADTSLVIPYIKNLEGMGLVEGIRAYGKKRYYYKLISEPMILYYYMASRYDIDNREVSIDEVMPTITNVRNLAIENFIADFFAEVLGGRKEMIKERDREIDILITVRNKPVLVGEVKWGRYTKQDISDFLDKVEDFACRKIFFAKKRIDYDGVDVLTPKDLIEIAKNFKARTSGG
ncbi:MAG: ATP-binding protein [Thermoplasmata archaeon]|nr:MAG: ATP-binding protein [Thermoplasmata archaeon]